MKSPLIAPSQSAPAAVRLLPRLLFVLLMLVSACRLGAQTFVHPGALNTQVDFDRIKAKVATGEWPWYDSYVTLCNDGLSSLGWTWGPVSQITRGSGGSNNFSRSQKDAIAIYCLALRYRISGDSRYADKAIEGMDRWSSTMTAGPNGDNWGLAAGLCGYEFAVAGETLRGYPGWSQTSIDHYKSFLGFFANANIQFLNTASLSSRSNWLTDNAASLAACGVFCDSTAWFNQAINYYKYGHTNGQVHIWAWFMHPEGIIQMEESGRDQAHVQDAISSMAALCEIADHQGIDLYGYDNNRVLRAAEYFAKFNSWVDVPYTAYYNNGGWTKDHWEANLGYGGRGAFQPVWEMLNAHYVKNGIFAPYTAGYAAAHRPSGNVGNWNSPDVFGYDTLTHYQDPPTTDLPPSGLMANFSARQATLTWLGSPRATSYNVKRSTAKGGPYTTIATTNAMTVNYVDDAIPGGQTYYYVVSAVTPSGETANSAEAIGSGCATRYDFEGDASDSVGTFPGTLACSGNSGLPGFTAGHGSGQAISLNGIDQYVQLPFGTFTHQDVTVSAWIYWRGGGAWQRIFDTGDTNTNRNMYLTVSDGSQMRFYISDGWHDYDATLYGPVPALNTWMHVAVTVKAGSATLYQNGVVVDSKPVGTYPLFGQTYTYIGKSLHNDPYFNGAIDDFRINNGALSGADIYALGSTGSNHAPKFVSDPFYGAAAQEGVSYTGASIYTKASDQDGGPLVFTKLSGPSWLSVAPNGAISGTPSKSDVGINRINVRVTDSSGATDDATLYITVNNVNEAPTWTSSTITAPSVTRNNSYAGASLAISANDADLIFGDSLTFSKVSGPSWLTVAPNGALSGTPQSSDAGLNTFSVRVTDASGLSADATLNITVLPYSLRSQYSFEGNLNDSVSGYTGTAIGSPTYVTGRSGSAISFNGSSDFVSLPAAPINSKEITITTWVYWNGGSNNQRIFDFGNSTTQYLELCPNTGSGMRFETVNGGTVQQINYASALPAGRWVHVAVVLGASGGTLYVDGTAVATNANLTISPLDFSPQANYIGKSQWGADPLWNGKFDDFRIYNYALSASEIAGIVGSIAPPAPSGFSAAGGNGSSQITLTWSASVGASSYNVKRATTPGGPYTTLYSGSATTYTDTTGTPGVTYYYIVTAVDAGGESVASNSVAQFANGNTPRTYLRLDESSGTTASDSSGNGWNGTLVGGSTWAAGKINNAVSLSGSSNYVTLPSGIVTGMTDFTVSAWVKLNASNNTRIFDFGTGTSNYMELCPKDSSTGYLRYVIVSGGTVQLINTTYTFPTGVWTHVALTQSGATGTLYVNGTSVGTNTSLTLKPTNLGNTTLNYIGKSQWSNDFYLNGSIDEFQIYIRALSSTEVAALAASIPAPTVSIAAGDAQATLTWNSVANATGYNVKRSSTSGGPYTTIQANISGTTFTDTSLINSAGYYYVVTALNGPAESANSSEVTTTPVGAPPVPTGLQATGGNASVSLTWTSSYGATSYKILRSLTSGSGYAQAGTSTTAGYTDTSLTNGTTYFYKVSAVGPNGESAASTEASATPLALPAAPTGLTATASNGAVTLTWTASVSATSYNVKRTTTSGSDYSVVATTNSPSFVDTGLTNGSPVYYVVSAINAIGEGSNSSEVSATPVAPPAAPTITVASGSGMVGIQWSAVSGATSYSLKRSGTSGGPYTVLTTGTGTSYLDTSVTNGSVYYYVVTASNAGGEGSASAEGVANPTANALRTFLRFDEQSGSSAGDSTGNGWNGILVGGSTWTAGKINNAISFSGSANYATLPSGLMAGVTDFTVTAWVKLNTANNTRIFDFGTGTSAYMELCPKNSSNGFMRYEIVSGGTVQQINTTYTFPTGVWTYVALTQSGSTGTLYINGSAVGTNTGLTLNPSSLGSTTLNYIGKSQWSSDPYLNGLVDEFQIYGRALSASEIGAQASPLAAPTGLTATAGASQVACSWNTVAGATSYNLKRAYINGGPYTTLATLTGTTYTDTSTAPQSPYYYVVTAANGVVESANSTQVMATPLTPAPVVSSAATASGTNGVSFSYQIAASNFPTSFSASGLPAGLSVNSNTGLISGTPSVSGTFTVSIGATNSGGTGNATLTITLRPAGPVINSALSVTGTSGSAFSYTITASNSPTSFAASGLPAGLSVNTSSGVISGTPTGTGTFYATISASNSGGTGSATLKILLISGSFGAPTGLSAMPGVNTVSLAWTPVAGASSYKVKRSLTSGSNYTTVATGLASPSYSDSGLTNRTAYFYVVSAVTSGGTESANSSEAGAIPLPPLTWTGNGSDTNWMAAGNWSSQPVAGDPLFFEGSLRLSNTNNYAANTQFGGITFNNGAGAFSLNGNAINLAGDIVNNSTTAQTITLNLGLTGASRIMNAATANLIVTGVISQNGANYGLIKIGAGELTLYGANTFAGGVMLNQGYLNAENHASLGTGILTLAGGTLRNLTGPTRILSNPVYSQPGTTSFVRAVATTFILHGNLSGNGTVDICGTYNAAGMDLSGDNSGFTGIVNVSGPNLRLDAPESGSANAAWIVGVNGIGGLQLNAPGTTNMFQLGSLSGNGCIAGHFIFSSSQVQTLSVGALGTDSTFSGSIVDNAVNNSAFGNADGAANNVLALTKVGAGTLTLTGTSSYTGPTIVNGGTLKLNGTLSGTSSVTVNGGAAFAGSGTSSGSLTVANGGTIAPGDSGAGTLSVNGGLTLQDGSILNVQLVGAGTSDKLAVTGGYAVSGVTTVNVSTLSGFAGVGTYPILTGATGIDVANFALGTTPTGYTVKLSAAGDTLSAVVSAPDAPTGLTATAGQGQVSLSWNPSAGATSYTVLRSITSGSGYTQVAGGSTSATSFADTSAAPGTTYYYVVTATNLGGTSGSSNQASATTIPAAPTGLTISSSNGHVSLSWNASVGASGYTILRATSLNGPYTALASGVTGTSYVDTTALPGWTYYYAVAAGNGSGQSQSSASTTTTAPTVGMSWLKLDETSGTTAADASGNNNVGTLVNSPTWIGGKIGNALSLNGTNNYASLPNGAVSNLHDFTVSAWVYWNGSSNWQRVFDFGSGTTVYMFLTPKNGVTGTPRFAITASGGGGEQKVDAPSALTTGTWHHIAVTLSGSTGTLYVDGQQVGQNTAMTLRPSDLGATTQNWIGRSQYNDPYLNGRVDDFRLYAGALSATDIAALAAPIQTTGLTATGGNGQVALTWNATTGATSYTVRRAAASGAAYTVIASGIAGTSYTDTNLTNGTSYYYVVTPANASGDGANSAEATTATIPSAPTGLAATGGTGQIALTWNSTTGASTYNVLRAASSNGSYTTIASGVSSTSYTDTSVASGTTYYYAVTAANGSGSSANSSQVNAITAPDSPASITATGGNGQIALSWSASTGAASYSVLRATSSNGSYTTVATGLTGTSYTDTGLSSGTTYYYAITATNGSGSSANSAQVNTITIPDAPTGPAATGGTSQIALTWNASTGASTYNVLRATSSNGSYTTVATGLTGTSYSDTGLSSGTTYYYAVTATNGSGSSANSTQVSAITAPASPGSVTATAGNGQVALSWTASSGATGYSVLRATSSNGTYTTIASGLAGTSYTDTGLANGTTYYYAVVASNGSGSSANSTQVNAITAPAAPTGLTATPDNAQVSLLWNSSTGAATYNVLRSTTSGSGYTTVASGIVGTSYTDTGLTNGTTYYYIVTATNTGGTSANSNEASGMPVALPSPWATSDIGSTGAVGSASRSPSGVFTLTGAGADIWGSNDAFRYVYQTATGDCDITARVVTLQNTNNAAKGGVMIRESLNANSTQAMTNLTAANGLEFLRRTTTGGSTSGVAVSGVSVPYWVRLVRSGNTFTSYRSSDGVNWTNVGSVTITMASNVYIGLLVCSHVNAVLGTTTIDNVIVNP